MKKTLWAVGKAAFAVIVFVYLQVALSMVFSTAVMLNNPTLTEEQLKTEIFSHVDSISLLSGVLAVAALWLVWWLQGRSLWKQVNLRRIRPTGVLFAATLGLGVCFLVTIAMGLIPWPEAWMDAYIESSEPLAENAWSVLGVLATIVAAPLVEEIVFRGVAYTSLKSVMPRWVAAILVSAVFGLMHGAAIWFCYTFVLSFVMIWVYEQTKSLWGPIAVHTVFNTVGQLPLMGEDPSFAAIVLVAGGGVALTAMSAILLYGTQPQE